MSPGWSSLTGHLAFKRCARHLGPVARSGGDGDAVLGHGGQILFKFSPPVSSGLHDDSRALVGRQARGQRDTFRFLDSVVGSRVNQCGTNFHLKSVGKCQN